MEMNTSVRITLHEMLKDRGYNKIECETNERIVASKDENTFLLIYFVYDFKVSVKRMKSIKELLDDDPQKYECLILVYKSAITAFAKQFISNDVNDLLVQVFSENELSFNITKHELVPKHELLTIEEKKQILKIYKTSSNHFPIILASDPVARYYGLLPGSMVRITRPSVTAKIYISYRVVA